MARPGRLTGEEISAALEELDGWELRDAKLHRELRFADFSSAFGFMAAVATVAQELDHHPEWCNVYSSVVIDLTTHDAGGVTELDVRLARRMSELATNAT
ncbi:MAG: 4a-hydroxytetrahydrobiopterin dehydratase [Microthrixaceae bacterium]